MKMLWAALAAFFIASPALANEWSTALKDIEKKVPRLALQKDGQEGTCSAVVINENGHAVTAAHCIEDKNKDGMDITVNDRHAEAVKVNRILDLAVIKFEPFDEVAVVLAKRGPERGAAVVVAGYPFGIEDLGVQFGHVAIPKEKASKLMWVNVDLIFGDSGGAVLDGDGELVGINSGMFARGPAHMAVAVPIDKVRDFVKDYLPKEKK